MNSLRLSGDPFDAPEDAVRWLCAVQSQDYGPAKWSVGQRSRGVTDTALDRAYADGRILRTHVLRPTWHFVPPTDIGWMLELTAPRVHALNAHMYRRLELQDTVRKKCKTLLFSALQGGNRHTRKELGTILEGAGIATEGFRLAYILMDAELNAVICSGGPKGKQHTYALVDERAPQSKGLTHEEALTELALRYFTSHGPATAKDFKSWSSLLASDINQALEMVAPLLEHEVIDGVTYWFAEAAPQSTPSSPQVGLLQGYDEYIMGYSESRYVLDVSGAARSQPPNRVVFNHVLILDGQVAGHWKRSVKRDSVIIEVALYTPFDEAQTQALEGAADRHGRFLGLTATVVGADT